MKILLTGATGFLGRHVARALADEGHVLRVLHRPASNTSAIRSYAAEFREGDVTDPVRAVQAAVGMDAIVHMAADMSHWRRNRARVLRTNVAGTRMIAEAAKTAGVPVLVHTSSIAAVGFSADGTPIDETAPNNFRPLRLLYHESKRLAEEEALDAARYGVRVVIVNPGVLYGPRDLDHVFGHTMLELAAERIPGHPAGGLSVADVEDVARAMTGALTRGRDGERYLLAGENVRYGELFARQAKLVGKSYRGKTIPASLLRLAALGMELRSRLTGREPRLTKDNATIAPLLMWYSSAKAQIELGYRARPLDQTLERMARAYRAAGVLS